MSRVASVAEREMRRAMRYSKHYCRRGRVVLVKWWTAAAQFPRLIPFHSNSSIWSAFHQLGTRRGSGGECQSSSTRRERVKNEANSGLARAEWEKRKEKAGGSRVQYEYICCIQIWGGRSIPDTRRSSRRSRSLPSAAIRSIRICRMALVMVIIKLDYSFSY